MDRERNYLRLLGKIFNRNKGALLTTHRVDRPEFES
jgi:hypothetical protein